MGDSSIVVCVVESPFGVSSFLMMTTGGFHIIRIHIIRVLVDNN
jgi:hypothetical protein